jgi:hypothetical protein
MKTLRRIGILVIVTLALAFTACDDILEVFYPEFASGEGVDFGIGIWIQIDVPPEGVVGDPQLAGRVETTWGEVIDGSEKVIYPEWIWDDQGNLRLQGFIEFGIMDPGEYRIPIWLELHDNSYPEFDEPVFFARWQPDPEDPDFWDDIFRFETGTEISWINGEAILGGLERINYNFKVVTGEISGVRKTSFVIQAEDPSTVPDYVRAFDVMTVPDAPPFVERVWRLFDPSATDPGMPVAEQWTQYPGGINDEQFAIDFLLYTDPVTGTGEFWLEIELWYDDGGWAFRRFPIRVIDQALATPAYNAVVAIFGADWDPLRMEPDTGYPVIAKLYQGNGTTTDISVPNVMIDEFGTAIVDVPISAYNPTEAYDGDTIDILGIVLDLQDPGVIGDGDWQIFVPLGLSATDAGTVEYGYESWMLLPVFSPPPE